MYRGLNARPQTPPQLAARTGCAERYVREWLANQAAGGYVSYDVGGERFFLSAEQAFCLADPSSPAFLPGGLQLALSTADDRDRVAARFRTGDAMGWHEHHHDLFEGTERFFRPGYVASLTSAIRLLSRLANTAACTRISGIAVVSHSVPCRKGPIVHNAPVDRPPRSIRVNNHLLAPGRRGRRAPPEQFGGTRLRYTATSRHQMTADVIYGLLVCAKRRLLPPWAP